MVKHRLTRAVEQVQDDIVALPENQRVALLCSVLTRPSFKRTRDALGVGQLSDIVRDHAIVDNVAELAQKLQKCSRANDGRAAVNTIYAAVVGQRLREARLTKAVANKLGVTHRQSFAAAEYKRRDLLVGARAALSQLKGTFAFCCKLGMSLLCSMSVLVCRRG